EKSSPDRHPPRLPILVGVGVPGTNVGHVQAPGGGGGGGGGAVGRKILARRFSRSGPNSVVSPCANSSICIAGIPGLPSEGVINSFTTACARSQESRQFNASAPGVLAYPSTRTVTPPPMAHHPAAKASST